MSRSSSDISESDESIEDFLKRKNAAKRPMTPSLPYKPIAPVTKQKLAIVPSVPPITQRTYKVTASGGKILIPTRQEQIDLEKRIAETARKAAEKKEKERFIVVNGSVVGGPTFLDPNDARFGGSWERRFLRGCLGEEEYRRLYEFRNGKRKVVRDKFPRWRLPDYDRSDSNVEFKYDSMVYGKYLDSQKVILAAHEARMHDYKGELTKVAVKYEVDTPLLPPNYKVSITSLNPKYAPQGKHEYISAAYEYDLKTESLPAIEMENGTYMVAYRYYYYEVPTYLLSHPLMWYYDPKEHGIVNTYEEYTREGVEYRRQIGVQFKDKKLKPLIDKSIKRGKKMFTPLLDGSDIHEHHR